MKAKIEVNFKDLSIVQRSYVYRDIEKRAKLLEEMYNLPPFKFLEARGGFIRYRGKKEQISIRWAANRIFNTEIELIEWISGENSFKEFLDSGREGLHHVAVVVDDYERYLEYFKEIGVEVIQYGRDVNRWAYLGTEESIGVILEIMELRKGRKR
jgi:hypothetical protein